MENSMRIFFCGMKGKVGNESMRNVTEINICYVLATDVNETLAYETEMRLRHSVFGPRRDRDQDLPAIPRDRDADFCHETRPRPCKAETETFFKTFNLQHCAKTMNGIVAMFS